MQAACTAKGAQERILYQVQVQAASPAARASKRSCAPPPAAQLCASDGRAKRTRTGLGKCRQRGCRHETNAHAFLQALAFVQLIVRDLPAIALSALLRIYAGESSQASQAAASWAAALWGLLRTAALEHPDVSWTALGVDASAPHADTMQARRSGISQLPFVCMTCSRCWLFVILVISCVERGSGISVTHDRCACRA